MYLIWVNTETQQLVEGIDIDIPGDNWQLASFTRDINHHQTELSFWSSYKKKGNGKGVAA